MCVVKDVLGFSDNLLRYNLELTTSLPLLRFLIHLKAFRPLVRMLQIMVFENPADIFNRLNPTVVLVYPYEMMRVILIGFGLVAALHQILINSCWGLTKRYYVYIRE